MADSLIRRFAPLEYRQAVDPIYRPKVSGVVVTYGELSADGGERFAPGSIDLSAGLSLYLEHRSTKLLARYPGGGLEVEDDGAAVRLSAELPDTTDGRDAAELLRRGVLSGLSVEFAALRDHYDGRVRVVDRALVPRVALVDAPAYPGSVAELRRRGERYARRRVWL